VENKEKKNSKINANIFKNLNISLELKGKVEIDKI
jgi:hypothetical protein